MNTTMMASMADEFAKIAKEKKDFEPSARTKELEPYTTIGGPASAGLSGAAGGAALGHHLGGGNAATTIISAIAGGALGAGGMKMLQDYALKKMQEDGLSGKHDQHFEGDGFMARQNRHFMDTAHGHEGKIFGALGALQGVAHGAMAGSDTPSRIAGAATGGAVGGAGGYVLGKSMEHRNSLSEDMMQHRGKTTHSKGYKKESSISPAALASFRAEFQKIAENRIAIPTRLPRQASFTPAPVGMKSTVAPPPVKKPAPPKNGPLNPGGMMMH